MIDSCGLHIGCLLTCTSGVNVYTVELLATVTGTHTIEYHFLSRVIRFDIEATIGQQFEIPTSYFNESGDARIKIILPSGAYFTYTDGTTVYDTFYLTVRSSQDSNFIPAVLPPGVPFATQGYVNAAILAAIAALPVIASGTYTPIASAISNLDALPTMAEAQYMRVGNTVAVSGSFTVSGTVLTQPTSFEITLPIASNIGAVEDVAGVASSYNGSTTGMVAEIIGVVANDTAKIRWVETNTALTPSWSFTFTYQII